MVPLRSETEVGTYLAGRGRSKAQGLRAHLSSPARHAPPMVSEWGEDPDGIGIVGRGEVQSAVALNPTPWSI